MNRLACLPAMPKRVVNPAVIPAWRRGFSTTGALAATWGFVGLGRMGYPMAANLRAKIPKDDILLINDKNLDATSRFMQEHGSSGTSTKSLAIEVVESVRKVAERSSTIITALPESSHIKSVFDAILSTPLPDTPRLFIDCSTVDPTTSRAVATALQAAAPASGFVDAPMSGGVVGARAATLTFMLGGRSELIPFVRPILLHMGARVIHLGPHGAGLAGKLANNYLLAISNIATAEAMNMGVKLGLDPVVLGQLLNSSSGRCWSSEINNPVPGVSKKAPAERGYEGGFGTPLMRKDLRLAVDAAGSVGAKLVLGERAGEVYDAVVAAEGQKDFSVVYRWLGGGER